MDDTSPRLITRRHLLIGATTTLACLSVLPACQDRVTPPIITLLTTQQERALHESLSAHQLLDNLSNTPDHPLHRTLTYLAQQRAAHAHVLQQTLTSITQTSNTQTTQSSLPPLSTLTDLRNSLIESAQQAATATLSTSGYPSGLFASIHAACTVDIRFILEEEQ